MEAWLAEQAFSGLPLTELARRAGTTTRTLQRALETVVHIQSALGMLLDMSTPVIAIPVDESTADAYQSASADQQRRLQMLLRLRLRELTTRPARPLDQIMDEVGKAALEKGLTSESLSSILNEL